METSITVFVKEHASIIYLAKNIHEVANLKLVRTLEAWWQKCSKFGFKYFTTLQIGTVLKIIMN